MPDITSEAYASSMIVPDRGLDVGLSYVIMGGLLSITSDTDAVVVIRPAPLVALAEKL